MSRWDNKSNVFNKNGIEWLENYGVSNAKFGLFTLTAEWSSDGYKVHIDAHATSKNRPNDFIEAEKISIDLLRLYVKKMNEVIELYDKTKTGG